MAGLAVLAAGCGEQREAPRSERVQVGPAVVWADPVADVRSGMPAVGSCHRLPRDISGGSDLAVAEVPCTEPHTSVTYAADVLPEEIAEAPASWVAERCSAKLAEATGLSENALAGAFVEWVWLQPDASLRERGARWFRCEVRSSRPGPDADLPGRGLPVFTDGVPEAWLRCVDTTGAAPAYVGCDQPHQFRWTGSIPVANGPHPTPEEWEELAAAECRDLVGPEAFWFTYPNRVQWRDGDHRLSCYGKA